MTTPPLHSLTRQLGDGFAIVGTLQLLTGGYLAARAFEVVPADVAAAVSSGWPASLIVAGLAWAARGARAPGLLLAAVGVGLVAVVNLPADATLPALLVLAGALVLASGLLRRRLTPVGAELALFGDLDRTLQPGVPHGLLSLFGEIEARLPVGDGPHAPLRAVAVFGSVELEVPGDVAVDVAQTAIFGDVRAPTPLPQPTEQRLPVRALAVFGDVRIRRGA